MGTPPRWYQVKLCTKCGIAKPHFEYYKTGKAESNRQHSHCKACVRTNQRQRRAAAKAKARYRPNKQAIGTGLTTGNVTKALSW